MIVADNIRIWHPGQLYDKALLSSVRKAEEMDRDLFVVPNHVLDCTPMKPHQAATAYKVGFLTEYLRALHPDYRFADIANVLFHKYQLFLSERNMQNYLNHWREHQDDFLQHDRKSRVKN